MSEPLQEILNKVTTPTSADEQNENEKAEEEVDKGGDERESTYERTQPEDYTDSKFQQSPPYQPYEETLHEALDRQSETQDGENANLESTETEQDMQELHVNRTSSKRKNVRDVCKININRLRAVINIINT